jgi:hypothetical protein
VSFVSVEMGGKNVHKQKYSFSMEANKNRHKGRKRHGILVLPFRNTVRSPGMVKDSEREEKKLSEPFFFPLPFLWVRDKGLFLIF